MVSSREQQHTEGGQEALINTQHVAGRAGNSTGQGTILKTAMHRGFRGILWVTDTPVAVSVEIWFDLINIRELEPHKDKVKKRSFLYLTFPLLTHQCD